MITLDTLKKELDLFNKMYEIVRIVDPVRKKVLDSRENSIIDTSFICHNYWEKGRICENCISVRAHNENNCFIKLEQGSDFIMMVMAIPIEGSAEPLVLELLKNATDSLFLGTGDYSDGELMVEMVSRINEKIVRDSLTSVYNRRFIDERLPAEIVRSIVEERPLSVIMMDVDNLKEINDQYGHPAGDKILEALGKLLREKFNSGDCWAARYGGDEFFLCLSGADSNQAYRAAEEIRSAAGQSRMGQPGENNPTLSIGIYTMERAGLTAQELINQADVQMYRAKKQGKDGIVQSSDQT